MTANFLFETNVKIGIIQNKDIKKRAKNINSYVECYLSTLTILV